MILLKHIPGRWRPRSTVRSLPLAVFLVWTTASSAAPVVGLHADFDLDAVGQEPATDPPGDPDEDSLRLYTQGGSVLVQDSFGDLMDQPVVVTRSRNGYGIGLGGLVDPDQRFCSFYTVSWRSLVDRNVQFFYMSFSSSNSQILGSVEYRLNGVDSVNGSTNEIPVGYVPNVAQFFEVELDLQTKTLNLSIDGVPVPEAQGIRFINVGPDGLRYVGTGFGMLDLYSIAIDDLHVEASGCPGVAIEQRSWGALKGTYR
jgi:hypothetical protein